MQKKAIFAVALLGLMSACMWEMAAPNEAPVEKEPIKARLLSGSPACRQAGCEIDRPLMVGTWELFELGGNLSSLQRGTGALVTDRPDVLTIKALSADEQMALGQNSGGWLYQVQAHGPGHAEVKWLKSDGEVAATFPMEVKAPTALRIRHLSQAAKDGKIHLRPESRLRFFVDAMAGEEKLFASRGFTFTLTDGEVLGLITPTPRFSEIHQFFHQRQIARPVDGMDAGWAAATLVGLQAGTTNLKVKVGEVDAVLEVRVDGVGSNL